MFITRTLVIGAGGSGGQLIPSLARLLTYHDNASDYLVVADGDAFEEHNRTRQVCGPGQIGQNKAVAMSDLLISQGLICSVISRYLDKAHLRRELLRAEGTQLVVTTVDNDATRKAVIDVLAERRGDWVHVTTGNADDSDGKRRIASSTHWHGVIDGEPFGLNPALLFDNIANPSDAIPAEGSCANHAPSAPQLISANALSAAMALLVIQNLLDGQLHPASNSCFANGRSFKLTCS